jgi:hypothetical protein
MITLVDAKWCINCASIETDFLKVFHLKKKLKMDRFLNRNRGHRLLKNIAKLDISNQWKHQKLLQHQYSNSAVAV